MLIVLEGQDCTGKTTIVAKLKQFLEDNSFLVDTKSFPEKTEYVMQYLEHGESCGIDPREFQTACFLQKMHWQHTKEAQDKWWVLDRWGPSGTIYGYLDRCLNSPDIDFESYIQFSDPSYKLLEKPVAGFILTCKPELCLERQSIRGNKVSYYETLEKQGDLKELYTMYADRDKSYKLIDTSNISLNDVYLSIEAELKRIFSL